LEVGSCGRLRFLRVDLWWQFRLDLGRFGGTSSRDLPRFRILRTLRRPLRLGGLERSSGRGVLRNPGFRISNDAKTPKRIHRGRTEVISDARRSRSWAKKESSSLVRDMIVIVPVKEARL